MINMMLNRLNHQGKNLSKCNEMWAKLAGPEVTTNKINDEFIQNINSANACENHGLIISDAKYIDTSDASIKKSEIHSIIDDATAVCDEKLESLQQTDNKVSTTDGRAGSAKDASAVEIKAATESQNEKHTNLSDGEIVSDSDTNSSRKSQHKIKKHRHSHKPRSHRRSRSRFTTFTNLSILYSSFSSFCLSRK